MMIDVHAHILPGMDDGSENTAESIKLLRMMKEQGTDAVCATSHFYASREDPEHFLKRRKASCDRLEEVIRESGEVLPLIRCGAEIRYFEGIGYNEDVLKLRTEGTDVVLLEMPFEHWTEKMLTEVLRLGETSKVILAHTERYLSYDNMKSLDMLHRNGMLFQSNAEIFIPVMQRRKALKYLNDGFVDIIASDAHSVDERPPQTGPAMEYISKKAGEDALRHLEDVQRSLLI